jgi:4-amino-4-deoxychorismate lyase
MLVNGAQSAVVSAFDRGLAYGDGVFRTLCVLNGKAVQWQRQYSKLHADCSAIRLECPGEPLLAEEIQRVAGAHRRCAVKIIITRGAAERGYRYDANTAVSRIVLMTPYPAYPAAYSDAGVRVRRCALKLAHQPALAGVKHLNRLENVLARAEWDDADIAEGLLLDDEGHLIGGTMTNVFLGLNGTLVTPDLRRCGVAGVTRDRVIEAANRYGITCTIRDVQWQDLVDAQEAFLVNSLIDGAWPISEVDGVRCATGPLARLVQTWLRETDDAALA